MRLAASEARRIFGDRLDELPSYRERLNGPEWASSELTSTEPAREKLRAWLDATPPPWPEEAEAADVREQIHFSGDGVALILTAAVIGTLPPPVRDYAIRTTSFVGVVKWAGFCGNRLDPEGRPWFVALSPGAVGSQDTRKIFERFRGIVAHEVAHVWLEREPAAEEVWMSSDEQGQLDYPPFSLAEIRAANPEAANALQLWRTKQRGREDLVGRLVSSWGFRDITTK